MDTTSQRMPQTASTRRLCSPRRVTRYAWFASVRRGTRLTTPLRHVPSTRRGTPRRPTPLSFLQGGGLIIGYGTEILPYTEVVEVQNMESALNNKKYYYVYQTTNLVNGKTYIGVHGTNNMNDGYIGCGIYRNSDAVRELNKKGSNSHFIKAVAKYGYKSFKRYELAFFDSMIDALEEEKFIVNKQWVISKDNYNSTGGGRGRSFNEISKEHKSKLIEIHSKEYVVYDKQTGNIYFVKNLHQFCRDMGISKSPVPLYNVINGRLVLYKKRYWACKREDWTGLPNIREKANKKKPFNKYRISVIRPDGVIDFVENISSYSISNNLDTSSMYKLSKGHIDSYRGYKIERFA